MVLVRRLALELIEQATQGGAREEEEEEEARINEGQQSHWLRN